MSNASDALRGLLATYERSLNTSDPDLAASCYTADGIFMPTTLPTAAGTQLRAVYANIFAAIRLKVTFTVDELAIAGDDIAYALTRSNGEMTVLATGTTSPEANREMFIFRRESGAWKVARYMFNKAA
jgi:uncharacterized protein (TIGR02246 family)